MGDVEVELGTLCTVQGCESPGTESTSKGARCRIHGFTWELQVETAAGEFVWLRSEPVSRDIGLAEMEKYRIQGFKVRTFDQRRDK